MSLLLPDEITPTGAYGIIQRLRSDDWRLYHTPTGSLWGVGQAKTALAAVEEVKETRAVLTPRATHTVDGLLITDHERIGFVVSAAEHNYMAGRWEAANATHLARIKVLESLLTGGIDLIAAERERQISQEGWTPEHDDQHRFAEIAQNAALLVVSGTDASVDLHGEAINWGLAEKHKGNRIRQLTIAGALIAAEIDRLNRAALTPSQEGPV